MAIPEFETLRQASNEEYNKYMLDVFPTRGGYTGITYDKTTTTPMFAMQVDADGKLVSYFIPKSWSPKRHTAK